MYCQFHSHTGRVSEAQIFFYTIYDYHNLSMKFQFKVCNSVLFVSVTVEYRPSDYKLSDYLIRRQPELVEKTWSFKAITVEESVVFMNNLIITPDLMITDIPLRMLDIIRSPLRLSRPLTVNCRSKRQLFLVVFPCK